MSTTLSEISAEIDGDKFFRITDNIGSYYGALKFGEYLYIFAQNILKPLPELERNKKLLGCLLKPKDIRKFFEEFFDLKDPLLSIEELCSQARTLAQLNKNLPRLGSITKNPKRDEYILTMRIPMVFLLKIIDVVDKDKDPFSSVTNFEIGNSILPQASRAPIPRREDTAIAPIAILTRFNNIIYGLFSNIIHWVKSLFNNSQLQVFDIPPVVVSTPLDSSSCPSAPVLTQSHQPATMLSAPMPIHGDQPAILPDLKMKAT